MEEGESRERAQEWSNTNATTADDDTSSSSTKEPPPTQDQHQRQQEEEKETMGHDNETQDRFMWPAFHQGRLVPKLHAIAFEPREFDAYRLSPVVREGASQDQPASSGMFVASFNDEHDLYFTYVTSLQCASWLLSVSLSLSLALSLSLSRSLARFLASLLAFLFPSLCFKEMQRHNGKGGTLPSRSHTSTHAHIRSRPLLPSQHKKKYTGGYPQLA